MTDLTSVETIMHSLKLLSPEASLMGFPRRNPNELISPHGNRSIAAHQTKWDPLTVVVR